MKKVGFCRWAFLGIFSFIILQISFSVVAQNAVYYVATNGDDKNPGTLSQPFATWQKAVDIVNPGDKIYIRGGVYQPAASAQKGVNITRDGVKGNPICLYNYPGETPILDRGNCSYSGASVFGIFMDNADYWHVKGLTVRNLVQTSVRKNPSGFAMQYSNHNLVEQCTVHKVGYTGFYCIYSEDVLFKNCDAYDLYDSASVGSNANGGNADGWHVSYISTGDTIELRGCRMWDISDDGIDCFWTDGVIIVDSCWAFRNGRGDGGGNGYKMGPGWKNTSSVPTKFVFNCLAFDNTGVGFTPNFSSTYPRRAIYFYNNTAFRNHDQGFQDFTDAIPNVYHNNVAYSTGTPHSVKSADIHESNSWNTPPGVTVSSAAFFDPDFDTTGTTGPRQPDGSLPELNFLKLKEGSELIDKGIDVGLKFEGSAPDLGAYEYKSTTTIPVTSIVVSATGGAASISSDNGSLQLNTVVLHDNATNKNVKWTVTNVTGQATISSTGLVTAVANGTITARATANDGSGVYGTLAITITNQVIPVSGISVTGPNTIITDGGTVQLVATVSPTNATNKNVTWSIINETGKAAINTSGLVTAIDNGTVTARAAATDGSGVSGILSINISNQVVPVSAISVKGAGDATIITTLGGTLQLSATAAPANATDKSVTWSITNNTGEATISPSGLVTAISNGTVTARAAANDGSDVSGILSITISEQLIPVSAVMVSGESGQNTLNLGEETLQLNAAVSPDNATDKTFTWSVVNVTGQAAISSTGLLTALANGTVTAVATANDGSGTAGTLMISIQSFSTPVTDSRLVYIDPANNGDASQNGSQDHPYASWSMVTWKEGYSYLQKKGTVSYESKINIICSNVILGSYGEGEQPVISSNVNDFAIRAYEKSNILIKGLHIMAVNAISCIYILGESCDSITIENCTLESAVNGARILDGKNVTLRYNTFVNCSDAIYCYADNSTIYYNVFRDNEVAISAMASMANAEIYNNVFYNNGIGISNTYTDLTLYNNIFYLVKSTDKAIYNNQLNKLISDNNIFYPEQAGFIQIGDKLYGSLDDYQQEVGMDLNSITQDPQFMDVYNQNFSIKSYSPAINAGKLLGLEQDYFGTAVPSGGLPDIGLAELNTGSVTSAFSQLNNPIRDDFQVYPNPSRGIFNVVVKNNGSDASTITIKDLSGKTVYQNEYSSDFDFLTEIDISNMRKGIYIVSVEDKSRSLSQPIIIN